MYPDESESNTGMDPIIVVIFVMNMLLQFVSKPLDSIKIALLTTMPADSAIPIKSPKQRQEFLNNFIPKGKANDAGIIDNISNDENGFSFNAVNRMNKRITATKKNIVIVLQFSSKSIVCLSKE